MTQHLVLLGMMSKTSQSARGPLWYYTKTIEHGPVEIVDLAIKKVSFHIDVNAYQRVPCKNIYKFLAGERR
jgi:DNA polymerase sigma